MSEWVSEWVSEWMSEWVSENMTSREASASKNTETTKCNSNERPLLVKHKETLLNQQDVTALTNQ